MFARTATAAPANLTAGTIVSYQDMANPAKFYTVVSTRTNEWGYALTTVVDLSTGELTEKAVKGGNGAGISAGWVIAERVAA